MRILVVNPNTNTATTAMLVRAAERATIRSRGTAEIVGATALSGPSMIVDPIALGAAAYPTVAAAEAAVGVHHPDAVIVAAFGDPGADELRSRLPVPVVGIGQAAIIEAAARGRCAIVTSTPGLHDQLLALVGRHAPGADFAGIHYAEGDPVALAADPRRNVAALGQAIDRAVVAGAQTVVIGGGPLSDAARELAHRSDVVVIEPVPAAVRRVLGGEVPGVPNVPGGRVAAVTSTLPPRASRAHRE